MSVNRIIIKQDTVGGRIKKYRLEKGLTQKELAQKCGMFDSAIRRYELGTQNPKKETIERIATALEIPSTALLLPAAPTNEMIKKAIEDAVASVGKNSEPVSTSIDPVDIDKMVDKVSKSLFAGTSAIPEEQPCSNFETLSEQELCAIGERIKRFRQAQNMSQNELAKAIGASADTVRYYERGDVGRLRLGRIFDIAYELNVLPEELLTDDQSELERVYKEALNNYYDELNHAGKKEIVERAYELTQIPKYTAPDDSDKEET